jgi:hypothetical protein
MISTTKGVLATAKLGSKKDIRSTTKRIDNTIEQSALCTFCEHYMSDSININKFNAKGLNQNGRTTQKLYNMKDLKHKKSPKYILLIFKFLLE